MSYIYRAYDKNDRKWLYLDSLGNDYFSNDSSSTTTGDKEKGVVSLNLTTETIEKVDKYRAPLGLSRSRYIDYVINEHFSSVVDNE